jgi:hypothetical protein
MSSAASATPPSAARQLQAFLAKYSPELQREAKAARRRMRARLPGAVEIVYDNYNGLVIGFSPEERPSAAVFSLLLQPRWVTLCFLRDGPRIPDPEGLLRGSGSTVRSLRLATAADLDKPGVRRLMDEALRLAGDPFTGRGGRLIIKSISARQRPRC